MFVAIQGPNPVVARSGYMGLVGLGCMSWTRARMV